MANTDNTIPPAEQIMPAFMTALAIESIPKGLLEFDCTRQPGAVSKADIFKPIVSGAEGSRASRHSGIEPLILAVALARNCVADDMRMKGVYCFSIAT